MTTRERIRRWRLYYRSRPLFEEMLERAALAYWLPWMPGEHTVELHFRTGRRFSMRAGHWPLLPTACRLERIGADFQFLVDAKRVRIDGVTLYSPLWARDEAANYREVLLDDVYGTRGRDLSGQVVVDIGAYVGDSPIAFARRGARVHALEPSQTFCAFMCRNLAENALAERVTLHQVGLAENEKRLRTRHDVMHFVQGVSYTLARLPARIDLLKMDCEGAEYALLSDPRFLEHLSPREIRIEYHRGPDGVVEPLRRSGYSLAFRRSLGRVGILAARARRRTALAAAPGSTPQPRRSARHA